MVRLGRVENDSIMKQNLKQSREQHQIQVNAVAQINSLNTKRKSDSQEKNSPDAKKFKDEKRSSRFTPEDNAAYALAKGKLQELKKLKLGKREILVRKVKIWKEFAVTVGKNYVDDGGVTHEGQCRAGYVIERELANFDRKDSDSKDTK